MQILNKEQAAQTLSETLEFDPKTIPSLGGNAHNIQEAWDALVGNTVKFTETVTAGSTTQAKAR